MTRLFSALRLAAVIVGMGLFACSEDTTEPDDRSPAIVGVVLDEAGAAVPLARLAIDYTLLVDGGRRPRTSVSFQLPSEANVRIVVSSYTGVTIRTIDHGTLPAGAHSLSWSGRDDNDRQVAEGLYRASLYLDDALDSVTELFIDDLSTAERANAATLVADFSGRFAIRVDNLPTGVVLADRGIGSETVSVSEVVGLTAFDPVDLRFDRANLDLSAVTSDVEVEFVIPD